MDAGGKAGPDSPPTWDFHMQQGQNLEDENGDPAEGVGDDDGEEPLGDGHLLLDVVAVLGGLSPRPLDVVEHARVGQDDDEECHQVQACSRAQSQSGKERKDANALEKATREDEDTSLPRKMTME